LRKCRIAGVAAVASLAVWALPAAPAGAKQVCTTIPTPPYKECHTVISVKISIKVTSTGVTITIKVTDPFLTVKLYKKVGTKYKLVTRLVNKNVKGTEKLKIHPKPGKYEIKVKASAHGVSKTVIKKFTVK
jgi:hypothetical protein